MPGLVAILTPKYDMQTAGRIIDMAALMRHEDFHQAEIFNDPSVPCTAARVHRSDTESQPVFNKDRSILLFMEGEIYARDELIHKLCASQRELRLNSDAELLLGLYELRGERFAEDVNGSFLIVLHDTRLRTTTIASDRFGLCPAFYFQKDGVLVLSSEIKSLLLCRQASRAVNTERLAQYFMYDGILDDETLIKDIHRFPNGSIWKYKDGELAKRQYFSPPTCGQNLAGGKWEFAEEVRQLFDKIVPRYAAGGDVALSLTGGWDTRALISTLHKLGCPVPCFTFGGAYRDSMDVTLAAKIAASLDLRFTKMYLEQDFFRDFATYASKAIFMSDGVANVFQTHAVYLFSRVRELVPLVLSGKFGSQTMGRRFLVGEPRLDSRILSTRHVSETGPLARHTRTFNGWQGVMNVARWLWPAGFGVLQGCYARERFPFLDRELLDLLFNAPQSFLERATIQKYIVSRDCPVLAGLPSDGGEFISSGSSLADSRLRAVGRAIRFSIKLDRGGQHPRRDYVLTKLDPVLVGTGADRLFLGRCDLVSYRHWVKYELRAFFKNILEDDRTLSRSYLNPDFVRQMTAAHFGNRFDYTSEIRRIVSLELWYRQFIDNEPVPHGWEHT